jgi:hypothetical protein
MATSPIVNCIGGTVSRLQERINRIEPFQSALKISGDPEMAAPIDGTYAAMKDDSTPLWMVETAD